MLSATVIGRLGRDPESKQVGDRTVCNFSVATDYGFGDKKVTTWVSIAVWGRDAEFCQKNLKAKDRVCVMGEGYLRKWDTGSKSGAEFTLDAKKVEKIWDAKEGGTGGGYGGGGGSTGYGGGSGGTSGGSSGGGGAENNPGTPYTPDDSIPFVTADRWSDFGMMR